MEIAIDARYLNVPNLRGMGKYLFNLMENFPISCNLKIRLYADRPEWPFFRPKICSYYQCAVKIVDVPGYRFRVWEQFVLPFFLKKNPCNILHFAGTAASFWQPVPTVVTIHDTLPWNDPLNGSVIDFIFSKIVYPAAYKKASAIITISNSSKNDILKLWPSLRKKLFVIPHGVDEGYFLEHIKPLPDSLLSLGLTKPYFLYLGGALPRKRFAWALKVFAQLSDNVSILACGIEKNSRHAFLMTLPASKRNKVFFAPFISEEDMPAVYQNAVATLYPSLYEGFGLPVLESQAVGTPVVFSALGSLAELIGPGAIILDPYNLEEWVQTCQELLSERGGSLTPLSEAREWAKSFSWQESARRHIEVYKWALQTESLPEKNNNEIQGQI